MGSFFHATATRLSKEESIIKPASHCHYCNHKLKWYELIPIISFIIQKGRCRCCNKNLPISYLIIEIATGLLYLISYHAFGFSPQLIIALSFISILIISFSVSSYKEAGAVKFIVIIPVDVSTSER